MNKILPLVKKHLFVSVLIVAMVALTASHLQLLSKVNNSSNKVLSFDQTLPLKNNQSDISGSASKALELGELGNQKINTSAIPHPSCRMAAIYLEPQSNTYVAPTTFNTSFLSTADERPFVSLQDINGDNLPDFVYTYNLDAAGSTQLTSQYYACVYLNTGSNWQKAYVCFAQTTIDIQTGAVVDARYRGDCAGHPAKSDGDKESPNPL